MVRLESHNGYHLQHPQLGAIEYWITSQLLEQAAGTRYHHPVQVAIGEPDELPKLRLVIKGISLGFCYLAIHQRGRINTAQARRIMQIIHQSSMLQTLPLDGQLISPSSGILPGLDVPRWSSQTATLPTHLTLLYHLPVELYAMVAQLKRYLTELGCKLTIYFHDAKSWNGCTHLHEADIVMGDRSIGESQEYTLEQWLRSDILWPNLLRAQQYAHLQTTLDAIQRHPELAVRNDGMKALFSSLMEDAVLTPLFNYRYQVNAPPGVNGIFLNALDWFDFTKAWLPPPEIHKETGGQDKAALP